MTGDALLARAHAAGAVLSTAHGRIVVDRASRLLSGLLEDLRAHKSEVLAALAARDEPPASHCARCCTGAWWRTSTFPNASEPGPWCCSACTPPPTNTWIDACHLPADRRDGAS